MLRAIVVLLVAALLSSAAHAEARIALLITNQAYRQVGAALTNTHRDGEILKAALEKVGFKVWVAKDTANEGALLLAIDEHLERLSRAGPDAVGFFYYSGHGAADRPNGENFLIPTDMPITRAEQLPLMAARLDRVMSTLSTVGRMSFVVFDACRNVPLQRADKSPFKGFVPVREQNGLLIAFATEPGNVAIDNNLYARALAEELVKPGQEAAEVFRRVRQRVRADTQQGQSPEYIDRRDYGFHFVNVAPAHKPSDSAGSQPPSPSRSSEAAEAWKLVKDTQSIAALEVFVRRFGDTFQGDLAKLRLDELLSARYKLIPIALVSSDGWAVEVSATATLTADTQTGLAKVVFHNGKAGPNAKLLTLNMERIFQRIRVGLCRVTNEQNGSWGPAEWQTLAENIGIAFSEGGTVDLSDKSVTIPIPTTDPELKNHWLCMEFATALKDSPHVLRGTSYAHEPQDSIQKRKFR